MITQSFKHICSPRKGTLLLFGATYAHFLLRPNDMLGGTTMFLGEQMCSKLYLSTTFAYEFWLKCLQLYSCNYLQDLSNDRSQAYIKTNMRWLSLKKIQNICFFQRKLIVPQGSCLFPRGAINVLEEEFKLPWKTT
jgi:hypothetical protein